ncbi:hypothetical protein P3T18_001349 [Paraburkholderia sp. GAS199]
MSDVMKMTIDEVLNEAIMSSTPAIIVEGIDDLKTYVSIANQALDRFEVYAIETIAGHTGGCDAVVDAIRTLYALNDASHPVENFVLGIIDRDTREYRGELPAENAILTLNYYSLESHFVCEEVLSAALSQYARVHSDGLGPNFSLSLFESIEHDILDLYYFSLEALQCAIDENYATEFKYSYSINRRKQEPTNSNVRAKAPQLDQLAAQLGLQRNLDSLKKISSGKWLLLTFCEIMYSTLGDLANYCGKFGSEKCQFCRAAITGKCTYRMKEGVSNKTLYSTASENYHLPSLGYIKQRMSQISLQTASVNDLSS